MGGRCPAAVPITAVGTTTHNPPATDGPWPLRPQEVGIRMRQYEMMVILDPEIEERTVAPSLDKYLSVVTTAGGSVDKVDIWGRRRLSFEIKKKSEGIYAVVDFTATPDTAKELDRQLRLNEAVLRTKILRPDATAKKQRPDAS
jgi:small subunit ribosomal protein S6